MKTVYGLRMIMIENVISSVGARSAICNKIKDIPHVLDMFEDYEKLIVDTSISAESNFPIYNILQPYQFIFVAVELLEERLMYEKLTSIEALKNDYIMTLSRREKIDRILEKYNESYEKYSGKYSTDNIHNESCFAFAVLDGNIKDVFISTPNSVMNFLRKPTVYTCEVCGIEKTTDNTTLSGFLPEMYYKVTDNNIVHYVCGEHRSQEYRIVGE